MPKSKKFHDQQVKYDKFITEVGKEMSKITSTAGYVSMPTVTYNSGAQTQATANEEKKSPTNKEYIDNTILGKMYHYNIPKIYFKEIRDKILLMIMEDSIEGKRDSVYNGYSQIVFQKCDEILPTFNFNKQIGTLLDGDENETK